MLRQQLQLTSRSCQFLLLLGAVLFHSNLYGQADSTATSFGVLDTIIVVGYASDRPLSEVSAAIGVISQTELDRFNTTSILPAVNTIPGVRMEERSPGSFRFAIRGSSLRSPFGVRNVKVYWNGLPLTDGGGNTYLNILDMGAIGRAEIIKGPGSSLYGAGTGGVVLLSSDNRDRHRFEISSSIGSYGLQRYQGKAQAGSENLKLQLQFAHQQAEGYRQQSALRKDAVNADVRASLGAKSTIAVTLLYTDLFYETPGGLTLSEYNSNRKQSRPKTPALPGAVTQNASIQNKTVFGGISFEHDFNRHWSNRTGVYGAHTDFTNPAIRNYEERTEENFGGRTQAQFNTGGSTWKGKITFGGEFQYFKSPLTDYGNRNGKRDTLQFADRLGSTQSVAFVQTEADLPADIFLSFGASTTFLQYRFIRISSPQPQQQNRNFTPVFSPRVAVLKKAGDRISFYGSISKGFSTPTLAEVRPSSNLYNNTLAPETGWNYEAGVKGWISKKISFEVTGYYFSLKNTIVSPDGGDHYANSGSTTQPGVEAGVRWKVTENRGRPLSGLIIWSNFTYNPYSFKNYFVGASDYSGSKLTGIARDVVVSGLDLTGRAGWYGSFTFSHTGAIALKDGASISSPSYYLLGARVGFRKALRSSDCDIFGGVDNALNSRYSLGNDLNAAGGRYFNAAAPQNFYIGLKVSL